MFLSFLTNTNNKRKNKLHANIQYYKEDRNTNKIILSNNSDKDYNNLVILLKSSNNHFYRSHLPVLKQYSNIVLNLNDFYYYDFKTDSSIFNFRFEGDVSGVKIKAEQGELVKSLSK